MVVTSPSIHVSAPQFSGIPGALAALTLAQFVDGALPHLCKRALATVPPFEQVLPADAEVVRSFDLAGNRSWIIDGQGWRARLETHRTSAGGDVEVFATSAELAEAIAETFVSRCPAPHVEDSVDVTMWHRSDRGPASRRRPVTTSPWGAVARNYPARVRAALDELVTVSPSGDGGRVILLHGAAGTGKTSAIRSLLWEWRRFASPHVVLDGDTFVHDPGYVAEVTTQDVGDRWVVVIIEDAGDLVDDDHPFGGGLAQLLNLTDGIVGTGTRALFVLTTNEPIAKLHPAITRPGRCLANIEFTCFSRQEAAAWLGVEHGVPLDGLTLAELYQRRGETLQITSLEETASHGVYL